MVPARHIWPSLLLGGLAFVLDRVQKQVHVSPDCFGIGETRCVGDLIAFVPQGLTGWRGGEVISVTDFFDYVLVWNTGISYGLLDSLPAWVLGLVMVIAMAALVVWWARADSGLIRLGLALALGGALSNALDRLIWGAVADFFHFHWGGWSFYVFNLADLAITLGVVLLVLDMFGIGRGKRA
ncbi:MAG: signal peptidase II [Devosia sp.]